MIYTYSKFNYGFVVDDSSNKLDFSEGAGQLTAEMPSGSYTMGEYVAALKAALNAAGTLIYNVTVDRTSNFITISASANFEILLSSGSNIGVSLNELIGFTQGTDLTGASAYTGATQAGKEYYPQFMLQSYVPSTNYQQSADATINKTASGRVEIVRFGIEKFIEMDIKFITNRPMDGFVIKHNPTGLEDALDFLTDISQKRRFEFVADISNPSGYEKVILESFPSFSNGAGFKLKELFSQNLPDIYETGVLKLRVV